MSDTFVSLKTHKLLEEQSRGHEKFEKELEVVFKKSEYKTDREPVLRDIAPDKVLSVFGKLLNKNGF